MRKDKEKPEKKAGKDDADREISRALGLLTQLGFAMAACVFVGVFFGKWLDGKLGTSPWLLLLGCLLGAAAAFKVFYDLLIKEWMK